MLSFFSDRFGHCGRRVRGERAGLAPDLRQGTLPARVLLQQGECFFLHQGMKPCFGDMKRMFSFSKASSCRVYFHLLMRRYFDEKKTSWWKYTSVTWKQGFPSVRSVQIRGMTNTSVILKEALEIISDP